MSADGKLPVHGFVLAGGKSTRMGRDKALLELGGRTLIEIAVQKLRGFCTRVSIAGNRDDLARFAPVVHEQRVACGPAAGVEAGLSACERSWAMFIPVDAPLIAEDCLRRWALAAIGADVSLSNLHGEENQPAFCMLRREAAERFSSLLDGGERRLALLLHETARANNVTHRVYDVDELYSAEERPGYEELGRWLLNLNTPEDLAAAEASLAS